LSGATGFVYLISRLGVTGARTEAPPDLDAQVKRVRAASSSRLPVAVGFGISTPAQAAAAARSADGVVVGSALMDALAQGGVSKLERLTLELAAAVHA
jgi:tryptophan synthase alpha chain